MNKNLILLTGLILTQLAYPAIAQRYPAGLSETARAKFETYDTKIAAAIRESRSKSASPRDLATNFPKDYALAVLHETFGSDWTPIKAYADAALAELSGFEQPERIASEPFKVIELIDPESDLAADLAKQPAVEEGFATARLWDPQNAAVAAAVTALAQAYSEELAYHSMSGFASRQLFRSRWRNNDALVLFDGAWIFVVNYIRTPRGLFMATTVGMYQR